MRSLDGGQTWSAPLVLASDLCGGARVAVGPDGEVYVVWGDFNSGQVTMRKSTDAGASFGPPQSVAALLDNRGSVPPGYYEPQFSSPAAPNAPSLAVDRSAGPRRGTVYLAWTDYAEGTVGPASGTAFDEEPNDFFANATPVAIGDDIVGFVDAFEADPNHIDNDMYAFEATAGTTVWIQTEVIDSFPYQPVVDPNGFAVYCAADTVHQLWLARGFTRDNRFYPPWAPVILTLPATGRYYIAKGAVEVALRYRLSLRQYTPSGAPGAQDHRDVVLVRSTDGGATWSPKVRVNDSPPRFDDFLPSVVVDGLGQVHAAWYDRRNDPQCGINTDTYWTWSDDGGASFHPSHRLSSQSSWWRGLPNTDTNVGDQLGIATDGTRVHVLWTQFNQDLFQPDVDIYGARIEPGATAVAVDGFRAELAQARVRLRWLVQDATGIVGFRLHRAVEGSDFLPLGEFVAIRGPGDYVFDDAATEPGTSYRYRLEVVRGAGAMDWLGPVEIAVPGVVTRLAWGPARPNPFAEGVQLELATPHAGDAQVDVFDVAGKQVATLHRGALPAGVTALRWDGRDRGGRAVAAGVYLLRAEIGGETAHQRVIRIR